MPALPTARLQLTPVSERVASALSTDRDLASKLLGATLPPDWPHPGLLEVMAARAEASPGGDHFGVWAIIDPADASVVGDAGFKGPPGPAGTVEIGYSVLPGWRGRGYAAEAAGALVAWARRRPGVRAVVAGCDQDNVASIRTLERVGFHRTGADGGEIRWRYAAQTP